MAQISIYLKGGQTITFEGEAKEHKSVTGLHISWKFAPERAVSVLGVREDEIAAVVAREAWA